MNILFAAVLWIVFWVGVPILVTIAFSKNVNESQALNPSNVFLHTIRSHSCYPLLRRVHKFLTCAAVIGFGILWIVLMSMASGGEARTYATFTCVAVVVALLIEYGLFRLIVDAVDVLIVMGQHTAASDKGDADAPPAT